MHIRLALPSIVRSCSRVFWRYSRNKFSRHIVNSTKRLTFSSFRWILSRSMVTVGRSRKRTTPLCGTVGLIVATFLILAALMNLNIDKNFIIRPVSVRFEPRSVFVQSKTISKSILVGAKYPCLNFRRKLNKGIENELNHRKQMFNVSEKNLFIPGVESLSLIDLPNNVEAKSRRSQPKHCKLFLATRKKCIPATKRPPWFDLNEKLNSTDIRRIFYLTAEMPTITRLGNRMFLYASLFGIAWRNSRRFPLWNDTGLGLRVIFKQLRIDEDHRSPYRTEQFTGIDEFNATTRKWTPASATNHLPPINVHLRGYFLNSKYFSHIEDQLRHDFTFSEDVIQQAQSSLDSLNASRPRDVTAGQQVSRVIIHVRRTDYSKRVDKLLQHKPDFFKRSMAYFTDCLLNVHFIVISDDISWCRRNILAGGGSGHNVYFLDGHRSPVVDLAVASLCDHAIITFGSFGYWVAWFANGVTLKL